MENEPNPATNDGALYALVSIATRTDDPDQALDQVLRLIASDLRADFGWIALLSPDSGRLEVEARFQLPAGYDQSLPLGQGLPGWAALHGKPILADESDPRQRSLAPGNRGEMASPLLAADGQVVGVVCLGRTPPGNFNRDDLARLASLTDEAGRVMRRIWQLDQLRGKALQLETLISAGQSLVSKLEQEDLFHALTRDTRSLMQARACVLYLFDPAAGAIRFASASGAERPAPDSWPLSSCLVAAPINTRRPVAFADVQSPEYLDLADLPRDSKLRSALATPLAYEGEVLGVLAIFLDRIHRFDDDEKRLCQALGSLGAVTLQNSRLYARVFQSEETLRKNERLTMLGLIAAEIAHEIRNPLTVLKLLLGGLGADLVADDPRRTDLRVMSEKLDQLETIVTRVLNFGRAPSNLRTRCALAEVLEDTLVLVRLKLAQSKIHLRYEAPARALIVSGHKGQLQQVLLNLLLNAIAAMPQGGEINLTMDWENGPSGPAATITVADTGAGIPEPVRARIFDSFLSGRPDGTGLGLAIVKQLLASHGGEIAIIGTGPSGTTFRLKLPLARN